ncbi:MAG: hypothetical protein ACXV4C_10995 [Halobacteriota archaeon]
MLSKADTVRTDQLIRRLSDDSLRCDVSAETELLNWCLHHKDISEVLKEKSDSKNRDTPTSPSICIQRASSLVELIEPVYRAVSLAELQEDA